MPGGCEKIVKRMGKCYERKRRLAKVEAFSQPLACITLPKAQIIYYEVVPKVDFGQPLAASGSKFIYRRQKI
jgi:hypothetical protein